MKQNGESDEEKKMAEKYLVQATTARLRIQAEATMERVIRFL